MASGLPVAGLVDDTALAAYLCRPDQRSFDLADLVLRHLHREMRLEEPAGEPAAPADADDQLLLDVDGTAAATTPDPAPAAAVRATAVLELSGVLAGELAERGGTALLAELEKTNPHVRAIMANALRNVRPSHLLDRDVQRAWAERAAEIRPAAPAKEPRKQHAVAEPVFSGGKLRVLD